jgi:hypothetical protein
VGRRDDETADRGLADALARVDQNALKRIPIPWIETRPESHVGAAGSRCSLLPSQGEAERHAPEQPLADIGRLS